ncbi:hypothetical protein BJ138DRAFT_1144481 [Hygrophoropsis aurantiaca]|uniref:Uncharacterized protein n=1 Tax=Hygrophoropsis aurantiaca TaxID=72124 RepID=A0ACB8ALM6_9AGAM|nr:hypothetical protein BJ138DRAFT_1144481 [Hygrophoropsis aurantiaca]
MLLPCVAVCSRLPGAGALLSAPLSLVTKMFVADFKKTSTWNVTELFNNPPGGGPITATILQGTSGTVRLWDTFHMDGFGIISWLVNDMMICNTGEQGLSDY